jgi:rhamnosyl/mannosyltransferase
MPIDTKAFRVLQINKLYTPCIGGVETVVQNIAEGLNSLVAMQVLVCQPKGRAVTETVNGVSVMRSKSYGVFFSMPLSLDFIRKFKGLSKQADIVQFHEPFPLGNLALLLSGYHGKVVVWWHSDIVRQKTLGKLLYPVITWFLKRADVIIAATAGHIKSSPVLSRYSHKCRIIPYGLDFSKYPEPQRNDFLEKRLSNSGNKKLLFVGRLIYYKGLDTLISAMESVSESELFIIGRGPLEDKMKSLVFRKNLQHRIHFLGALSRDELIAAYYGCDIFVLPSNARSEAFGIVQMEAMLYGKPVINTDLPTGVPYVSLHEKTGLTVPAGNAVRLAEAITRLVQDQALCRRYGMAAQDRVRKYFSISSMLNSVYGVYREVAAG